MSTPVIFYNTLDESLFQKIGYHSQPLEVSYTNETNEEVIMEVDHIEGHENVFQIVDPKVHWDPKIHDLKLYQTLHISNPFFLFGTRGLVPVNSRVGLAYKWYSKDSSQIRVEKICEFSKSEINELITEVNFKIPKGLIRGKVTFEVVIYFANDDNNPEDSQLLIKPGTILGTLEKYSIYLDGSSSIFPIVEVQEPFKPLWWVKIDFDEPLFDQFKEENVAIVINKSHKFSRQLKLENGLSSSALLMEIVASGLQIIIEKTMNMGDWDLILNNESEEGSIGEAIYYFISTFEWDYSSPESLAYTIREDLEHRLK